MTAINKQKFLVELGRLLTFMSEEDRQEALMLYEKMFDDAGDDQALLQALISPTRQAVIIARAYDAGARKFQAYAGTQRKEASQEEPEATPDFILAILRVYEEAVPLPAEPGEETAPAAPAAEEEEEEPEPVRVDPNQLSLFGDEEPKAAEEPEEAEPEEPAADTEPDEVDTFLSDFAIEEDELDEEETGSEEDEEEAEKPAREEDEPERRARPLLLILFVLFAIPLTLAATMVLLVPTVLSLALAAACVVGGCAVAVAAFSGFAIFADILIVLGCAIILLALGLLFLWLFIWFVGVVIAGLIRWVIQLGGDWCYEEVEA